MDSRQTTWTLLQRQYRLRACLSSAVERHDDETAYEDSIHFFSNPSMFVWYPEGMVNYRYYIIREVLPDSVIPGSRLDVIVGEVDSPQCFWVIVSGEAYSDALEKLTNEMDATPVWLPMHRDALLPGQFCAGHVDGAWRRIRIVHEDEHAHETVLVSLLDWGGHRTMTCDALRWLPLKFAKLPQQALHARLTDDAESVQLVAGQQFTFRLVNCDFKNDKLVLEPVADLLSKFPSQPPFPTDMEQNAKDRCGDGGKKEVCCKMYRADIGLHVFCKDNSWMLSLKEVTERYVGHLHSHVVGAIAESLVPGFKLHFVNIAKFNRILGGDWRGKCMLQKEYSLIMVRAQDMPDLLRAVNIHDINLPDWNILRGGN